MSECEHGQLARSCDVCELRAEIDRLTAELERLRGCMARCRAAALAGDWTLAAACVDERWAEEAER